MTNAPAFVRCPADIRVCLFPEGGNAYAGEKRSEKVAG